MSKYSAFLVSPEIFHKDVTLPDGSVHKMNFRQLSGAEWRAYQIDYSSKNRADQKLAMQRIIQASLCEEDGSPALTTEEAERLNLGAMNALFSRVLECNGRDDQGKEEAGKA